MISKTLTGKLASRSTASMPAVVSHMLRNILMSSPLMTYYVHNVVVSRQISNYYHNVPSKLIS